VYDLDADLRPIRADGAIAPLTGAFLGDAAEIAAAQQKVAQQTAVSNDAQVADKVEEALADGMPVANVHEEA
jgi:hypothetical protein